MDALSNTAVAEISKLVEIESKMLTLEITRGRNEIVSLTEKLQLMENLLWIARGHKQDATAHGRTKTPTRVTDCSINNCFGRSQSEEGRPEIKRFAKLIPVDCCAPCRLGMTTPYELANNQKV